LAAEFLGGIRRFDGRIFRNARCGAGSATRLEMFLLGFPARRLVIRGAPLIGTPPPFVPAATERTAKILASRIAGMRQEADPAVATARNASPQMRMGLEHRVQRHLILLDNRFSAVILMPVLAKRENFREGYDKRAKLSVMIASVICMSSSYRLDAKASRGRAGIFYRRIRAVAIRSAHSATHPMIDPPCPIYPPAAKLIS
jgi:hypothetical protein